MAAYRRVYDSRHLLADKFSRPLKLWLGPKLSRTLDAPWSTDSQEKSTKFDATRCQILRMKCTKFDFRCMRLRPDPAGELTALP